MLWTLPTTLGRAACLAATLTVALLSADDAAAISRCEVLRDAESWVAAGVPYSQGLWGGYCPSSYCYPDPLRPGPTCWRSDCSGFVSATWNVSNADTYSGRTTNGYAPFDTGVSHVLGSFYDLQPGDALNNANHIMLFGGWTGPDAFFIYQESTCEPALGITVAHRRDFNLSNSYIQTFYPIRFNGIEPCNQEPIGAFDGADCARIHGWTQDADAPDAALDVHVYFDGPAGASPLPGFVVRADVYRPDLCAAIGSCAHGFELRTPPALLDGQPHQVNVYAIDTAGGSNPLLGGGPRDFACAPPPLAPGPEGGVKRWVTNSETFGAWRFHDLDVQQVAVEVADTYPNGPDIGVGPSLVRGEGRLEVYLVDEGLRRWVTSEASMQAWRFVWGDIQVVPPEQVDGLPEGPPVLETPTLIGVSPAVYLLDVPLFADVEPGDEVAETEADAASDTTTGDDATAGPDATADTSTADATDAWEPTLPGPPVPDGDDVSGQDAEGRVESAGGRLMTTSCGCRALGARTSGYGGLAAVVALLLASRRRRFF